jgi:hypothetical protein
MANQQQIQIKAQDEQLKGDYSNMMQVQHTKEEFILDFFMVAPPQGILASRVIMNPGHFKRMIRALQTNIEGYEEKFGKIQESGAPDAKIGFETK